MGCYYGVFATDKPDMLEVRERVSHSPGLPALSVVGEANDIGAVMRFVGNDPRMKEGLFSRVEVRSWDWSLGNPEQQV